jgi:tRNA (guanine-N7-)-methyltransferase
MNAIPPPHRSIRSYVLRQGRLTAGQERAFPRLWERFGVTLAAGLPLDFPRMFGNSHPIWMEIGFGNGETLAHLASQYPERNYLGIEVHRPGVGHLLLLLEHLGLENVRVLQADALEVLRDHLSPACLDGLLLLFPDPWPKQRHHKRRIVQTELVDRVSGILKSGGLWQLATDWEDYARHMLATLSAAPAWNNLAGPGEFSPRPPDRPLTRFERRGRQLGHPVWDLLFQRR